jgi:putative DNA primase/helicase
MTKLQWAKWFIDHGFAIFPIDSETKKPVIKEWQRYGTTPLSDEEKAKYLELVERGYNYAIPGGQKGLVILDFEDTELLKKWIGEIALNDLCAKTLCVNTVHGGIHVYIISDDIPGQKFNPVFTQNGKGIADLQSYNSYVVGPGSCINHKKCENGKCTFKGQDTVTCYTLYDGIKDIGEADLKGLLGFLEEKGKDLGIELSKSAKAWLGKEKVKPGDLEKLKEELAKYDRFKGKTVEATREEVCNIIKRELENIKKLVERQRLQITHSVVCEGKTYGEVGIKNDKGVDRSRTDWAIINVLLRHGVTNLDILTQLLPKESKIYSRYGEYYLTLTVTKAWETAKKYIQLKNDLAHADKIKEIKDGVFKAVSELILSEYNIKTFYQVNNSSDAVVGIFKWNKQLGIYEPFENRLRELVRAEIEFVESVLNSDPDTEEKGMKMVRVDTDSVSSIVNEIRDKTLTPLPEDPLRIAFPNVTLEWKDSRPVFILDRNEDNFAFHYIPHNIKIEELQKASETASQKGDITVKDIEQLARAVCPKTLEIFKQWVDDKWVLLFEIIGYTLYPGLKFKKSFMLLGPRDTGKSTFLKLLKDLLGHLNYSAETMSELFDPNNRFVVHNLFHKLANLSSETKEYSIDDIDRFKRLTGGDPVTADVKFKEPITFTPYAKLIVASNKLPFVRDRNDMAFWRRWLIIRFTHIFPNDDDWYKQTFTEEELEGILTVAIMAITRVFMHKQFDFEQTPDEIMGMWLSDIDTVYRFVAEYMKKGILILDAKNADLWVPRAELYDMYKDYCINIGETRVWKKTFARRLREYFGVTTVVKNINGERKRAFVGIAVNQVEKYVETSENDIKFNEIPEFMEYVKQNHNNTKEFVEIVNDFGDRAKANRFVAWCEKKRFCYRINLDTYRISAS